jgi:hypothetical protein
MKITSLTLLLIFLNSCAKPTVVEISMPDDNKLNCEQLREEIADTNKIKRDAEYAKTNTGGNTTRVLLFWPAWAKSLHNADKAIIAADNRNYHLIKLMKKKNCPGVDVINAEIINSESSSNSIAAQLKTLKEMYKEGDLTKEEYKKAKEKLLN